jgi:hypothetical protein
MRPALTMLWFILAATVPSAYAEEPVQPGSAGRACDSHEDGSPEMRAGRGFPLSRE